MATNPLVSVIVPVYKVEPYLRRCLDSIVGQTYKNLEIILVDDGSPDGCPAICDEYAANDSRIVVIHKENGGLSDARNAGLEIAKGEYISFVDSDDWVADVYIEALWTAMESQRAELAICNYCKTEKFYTVKIFDIAYEYCEVLEPTQAVEKLWSKDAEAFVTAWGTLTKASLSKGIRFPRGFIYEDAYTTYKILYNSSKTVFLDCPLYLYFQRPDGLMGLSHWSPDKVVHAHIGRYLFFKKHRNDELAQRCLNDLCSGLLAAYDLSQNGDSIQGFVDSAEIVATLRSCQKDHWHSQAPTGEKVKLAVFARFPALFAPYRKLASMIKR